MSDGPNEPEDESLDGPRPLPPFAPSEVEPPSVHDELPRLNKKAVWSVVVGIVIIVPSVGFGLFAGLVAIISATHARREIENSRGTQRGDQLAQIGMAIGGALLIKSALLFLLRAM